MTANITVVRSPEVRGWRIRLDVVVDGTVVGALRRGGTLVHEVPAGEHQVQAVWDSSRRSPLWRVTLHDGESETLYLSFISERAHYVRSPTKATDWLLLTPDGTLNNANGAQRPPLETRIRIALTALATVAFVVNLVASHGTTLKTAGCIVYTVSGLLSFVLLMRHFHRLYRSPSKDNT